METLAFENVKSLNDEWLYYISPRFITYRPKENFLIKTEKYTLKTADSLQELIELFRLRHFVFLSESKNDSLIDVDKFDSECDHILIRCNKTNEICGTYRIITRNNHVGFYSETEFNISRYLPAKTVKMELGRACIHPFHRNGAVIDLLWRGIGEYATRINAQHLFGCSSMSVYSKSKVNSIIKFFEQNEAYSNQFDISPLPNYQFELNESNYCELFSEEEIKKSIPPLLLSYINAGAKVYGKPAFDAEFDCLDWLTILDLTNIKSSYKKRYFKNEEH